MSEHIIDVSDAASVRQQARRGHRRAADYRRVSHSGFAQRIFAVGCGWLMVLWFVLLIMELVSKLGLLVVGAQSLESSRLFNAITSIILSLLFLLLWGGALGFVFRVVLPQSRRAILRPAADVLKRDERPLVLYLRSFGVDSAGLRGAGWRRYTTGWRWQGSFEAIIVDRLWEYGPVVAPAAPVKGRRGEAREMRSGNDRQLVFDTAWGRWKRLQTIVPPMGAARERLPSENWQATLLGRMRQAQLIVVVVGWSEGLAWELNQVHQPGLAEKLVFVLPPMPSHRGREAELREQWESVCHVAAQGGVMYLPTPVDVQRTRAVVPGVDDDATVIVSRTNRVIDYEAAVDTAAEVVLDRLERRGRDLEYSFAPEVALGTESSAPNTEALVDAPSPLSPQVTLGTATASVVVGLIASSFAISYGSRVPAIVAFFCGCIAFSFGTNALWNIRRSRFGGCLRLAMAAVAVVGSLVGVLLTLLSIDLAFW